MTGADRASARPRTGSRLALFKPWDYRAFVTDRDGAIAALAAEHGRHAIVERAIAAEVRRTRAAAFGRFTANAAWLALTVIAHILACR
jgi:hypothetical protein